MKKLLFIAIIGLLGSSNLIAQTSYPKWNKKFRKLEAAYKTGDYDRALSYAERIIKTQDKKKLWKGTEAANLAAIARIQFSSGYIFEAEKTLSKAQETALKGNLHATTDLLLLNHIELAETMAIMGHYLDAAEQLNSARTKTNNSTDRHGNWEHKINEVQLMIDLRSENFTHAMGVWQNLYKHQARITTAYETVYNEKKGVDEERRVKRKVYRQRVTDLSLLLAQQADIVRLRGNYLKADSLYNENLETMKTMVTRKNFGRIMNDYGHGVNTLRLGDAKKGAKMIRKARKRYARKPETQIPNAQFLEMIEMEARANLEAENFRKFDKVSDIYRRESLIYFGKNSAHYLYADLLKTEENFTRGKHQRALRQSEDLLSQLNEYYPKNHIDRLPYLDLAYRVSLPTYQYQLADSVVHEEYRITRINMGASAPRHHRAGVDLARYEAQYARNLFVADSLYDLHFDQAIRDELNKHHISYVSYLNGYANMYELTDRFDLAEELYQEGVHVVRETDGIESEKYGAQLSKVAKVQMTKGNYIGAEFTLESAVNAIRDDKAQKSYSYMTALQTLGQLYQINGKYEEAKLTLKKAYRLGKSLGIEGDANIGSSDELATLYIETGRYDDADKLLNQEIEIRSSKYGANHFQLISPYRLLGELYLVQGEYIQAEKATRRSMDIAEETLSDTALTTIEVLVQLGDIFGEMGDVDRANRYYNRAIDINQRRFGETHISIADLMIKKARIKLYNMTEFDESIYDEIDEASTMVRNVLSAEHPKFAETLELMAYAYAMELKYDRAVNLLSNANQIYETTYGKTSLEVANNEAQTGEIYFIMGDFNNATIAFKDALNTYDQVFGSEHPRYTRTLSLLARTEYAKSEFDAAADIMDETTETYLQYIFKYFPSLSENEKSKYWNSIKTDFEVYKSLVLNYHEEDRKLIGRMYDYNLATKAILLSSSIKVKQRIMSSGDDELIKTYELWTSKREQLVKLASMSLEEQRSSSVDVNQLRKDVLSLEKELGERSEAFANNLESEFFDWKDVKKTLTEGEAAIEIIRVNYFNRNFTDSIIYVGLIITPETKKAPNMVILGNGNELEGKYFSYYKNTIRYKTKDKYSYEQYWSRFEPYLAGIHTIYISGDGVYNQINPETFHSDLEGYLIDRYKFYNVSNTKDLVIKNLSPKREYYGYAATMFGNPEFSNPESDVVIKHPSDPLPGAEAEVESISNFLRGQQWLTMTYLNEDATEMRVKQMESPRVFHVATHGFFLDDQKQEMDALDAHINDNPLLRSGLLFTGADPLLAENNPQLFNREDGILTAYEAMNLKLDYTELVVLSACETGLGEVKAGEGVYGLQRAFLVAGAQNIIMTLFKVNDAVTQELMTTFYEQWVLTQDKRYAFQYAKKQIKEKYPEPIYWGSFVMIGLD